MVLGNTIRNANALLNVIVNSRIGLMTFITFQAVAEFQTSQAGGGPDGAYNESGFPAGSKVVEKIGRAHV